MSRAGGRLICTITSNVPSGNGSKGSPMHYRLRTLLIVSTGIILVLFGLGCLNYTKASGLQHHTEVAERHGLPRPSERIVWAGAGSLLTGAGLIGHFIGSRRAVS